MIGRVLMVDDSDVNLAIYRGALHGLPDIFLALETSPKIALWRAESEQFDVLILDFHMPEMNGLEFLEAFRALPHARNSIVVMITAEKDKELRHRALDLGATDFLTKPVDRIELQARIRNLLSLAKAQRQLADRAVQLRAEVEEATATIRRREMETIMRLTRAAEFRDAATGLHVVRVGEMCAVLARTMGLPEVECQMLMQAAPMHDIGKVAIRDDILLKPGRLTAEEFETMKAHTTAGFAILGDSESPMLKLAAEIAISHHERWDGTGYPKGLSGSAIPLSGRLCSIVNVFDALTSKRPYKHAWPIEEALVEIERGRGSQFDPDLVALFFAGLDDMLDIKRRFQDDAHAA